MKLYVDEAIYRGGTYRPECERIAEFTQTQIELFDENSKNAVIEEIDEIHLMYDCYGLSLVGKGQVFRGDYSGMLRRLSVNNLRSELLVKASKIKDNDSPLVIDATAGMGEDSLLLAAAGFRVRMYERNPVIAALLEDTLKRAGEDPQLSDAVSRMEVICGDSIEALKQIAEQSEMMAGQMKGKTEKTGTTCEKPDVVYLDPMFPERQKSALVKKKFQLIHMLENPCSDEEEMLGAAIAARPHKIVIKRPLKGPFLSDIKPGFSLAGKAIRYDCIVQN